MKPIIAISLLVFWAIQFALQTVAAIKGMPLALLSPFEDDILTGTALTHSLPVSLLAVASGLMAALFVWAFATTGAGARLAGVLGHEIGHVTLHHGEDRIRRNNRAGIGVVIGTILGGVIGGKDGASDAVQLGVRLAGGYLARHSQTEEIEADNIGVRLLVQAGYNPFAAADFLEQLAAKEELERKVAGDQYNPNVVDFFASHPATGKRTRLAAEAAQRIAVSTGKGRLNEVEYLAEIDGLVYGDTAKEGFIRGLTFSHPEMRITITLPPGFILQNSPQQVSAVSKSGARFIMKGDTRWIGAMDRYIASRWSQAIMREVPASNLRDVRNLEIHGIDAAMALMDVTTVDGPRIAQLVALRLGDSTIRLVGLTTKSDGATRNALNSALQSFRRLTDQEIRDLQVYRLRVVTVRPGDTVEGLARTMPLTGMQAAQFRAMNGYRANADTRPGDLVEIVE